MNSRIKYLVSALALALIAVSPASLRAQDNPSPPPPAPDSGQAPEAPPGGRKGGNPMRMLQMHKDRLNLADDQVTKVTAILQDQRDKGMALRNDESLSQDDRRTKMMDLMKASHDQIRAILTPDQQKIFDTLPMNGPRGRRRGGGGGNAPPPPPANNT